MLKLPAMAHTEISLLAEDGSYIPSVGSISVVSGDSFSISTSDGNPGYLFFSPDAAAILSPAPGSAYALAQGGKASFSFTSSAGGAYSVFFGSAANTPPSAFSSSQSNQLYFEVSAYGGDPSLGGGNDSMTKGH